MTSQAPSALQMSDMKQKYHKLDPQPIDSPSGSTFHPDFMFCGTCADCGCGSERAEPVHLKDSPTDAPTLQTVLQLKSSWKSSQHALIIESLLQPVDGVSRVRVTKEQEQQESAVVVTVQHTAAVTDHQMQNILEKGGFPAVVVQENGGTQHASGHAKPMRTTLAVQGLCCASEVPAIRRIAHPFVSQLQINITARRVYVFTENMEQVQTVVAALTNGGFPSRIIQTEHSTTVTKTTLRSKTALNESDIAPLHRLIGQQVGVQKVEITVSDSLVHVQHEGISSEELLHAVGPDWEIQQVDTASKQAKRSEYVESTLRISNYTKKHATLLEKTLKQHFVRIRSVHATGQLVRIQHVPEQPCAQAFCDTLGRVGLRGSVLYEGKDLLPASAEDTEEETEKGLQQWNASRYGVVLSGIFWVVSLLSAVEGWENLELAGLFSVVFGLPPVAMKAFRSLRRRSLDANVMMVIAALGALVLGEWDEAASVSFLFAVSEYLEMRATDKAREALSELCEMRPEYAYVIDEETKEIAVVAAEQIPKCSLIAVRTGDKVSADGEVVEGTSLLDESSLTGESQPVRKSTGDVVSGGSVNVGDTQLVVRTTCSVEDSTVSRLIRLIEEAQARQSPTEKLVDNFAQAYTPFVLVLAVCMATLPWIISEEDGRRWTMNALIIIVIACPCALTISTPVTYAAGLAATAKRGVIIKGGATLEALGSVDVVALDKTGTLTEGKFAVIHLEVIGTSMSRVEMLKLLAMMEGPSSHPLSSTLVKAARQEGVSRPRDVDVREHTTLKGEGVMAIINGKKAYAGNKRLFERINMYDRLTNEEKVQANNWSAEGGTVGFLGVEGEGIVGTFCVSDQVRPEARMAVSALKQQQVGVVMLTGDSDGAARAVSRQVGIPEESVNSQMLPEDKLHFIGSLKKPKRSGYFQPSGARSKVLFCGDGVNDGPALAVADIGAAMGEGAALAMEMSDVTLMDSNLEKIPYILAMGKKVLRTIRENIGISLFCKLAVIGLTVYGKMTLLYAIASDVGVMLVVTLNGMKLLPDQVQRSETLMTDLSENQPLKLEDAGTAETFEAEIV